jgi:Fe-S-cluster containining protein
LKKITGIINFKCQYCGNCCDKFPVVITKEEAQQNKLLSKYSKAITENLRLLNKKDDKCIFLNKENKCSINYSKPLVCQMYPFYYNGKNQEFYIDILCPGVGKGGIVDLKEIKDLTLKFENKISKEERNTRQRIIFG